MNLHRVDGHPDWESVPQENRNIWQGLAARTRGWLTPGNAVTTAGNVCTGYGLYEMANGNAYRGIAIIGVGRALDLVDGWVADKTGTKSPLGEKYDAFSDKAQAVTALTVLAAKDAIPPFAAGLMFAMQASIAAAGVMASRKGVEVHPTQNGKRSMFASWIAILGYGSQGLLEQQSTTLQNAVHYGSVTALTAAAYLGLTTVQEYGAQAGMYTPHTDPELLPEQEPND